MWSYYADPCPDGDVADGKADPSACHQLGELSVLEGRLTPWTTNICLDKLDFLDKFLSQWLHCSGKQGRVASSR